MLLKMGGKLIVESRLLSDSMPERPSAVYMIRYHIEMRVFVSWLELIQTK